MSKLERILGAFPVFGKSADAYDCESLTGQSLDNNNPNSFVTRSGLTYAAGIIKGNFQFTRASLNGLLRYFSHGLAYLYQQGIPAYDPTVDYTQDAVVTYKGAIYISMVDNNSKLPYESSHWRKVVLTEKVSNASIKDGNYIGEIKTVPATLDVPNGWIDYVPGASFDKHLYPVLNLTLGTNKFAAESAYDGVPVGTMTMSMATKVPEGWVEFSPATGTLSAFPELRNLLTQTANKLAPSHAKQAWLNALANNSFPNFNAGSFFVKASTGSVGAYTEDSVNIGSLVTMPGLLDDTDRLKPSGVVYSEDKTGKSIFADTLVNHTAQPAQYAIQLKPAPHGVNMFEATIAEAGVETSPKALHAKLIVKATSAKAGGVPSTHKQIIKAFEV